MAKNGKIHLHGFNNLTKTLSFNIYDVCYASSEAQIKEYMEYIDEAYNSDRLTQILKDVASIIGASILNIAKADYDPLGASVTFLISEEGSPQPVGHCDTTGLLHEQIPGAVVAHLDKSHLTVHTYPEKHPHYGISSFRADIDVSTCGMISPLKALNFLIQSFESDIVTMDYRVRGFTRDTNGTKHYIDHDITSIQNFISKETKKRYRMVDVNIYEENIYHTKMMLREFDLNNYLFNIPSDGLELEQRVSIERRLKEEIEEIFYSQNIYKQKKISVSPPDSPSPRNPSESLSG
jgi:S-adenosylmethionine decarboxylase proenzyme, Escherichia coli form